MSYVIKYKNPFVIGEAVDPRLHNILTQAIMPQEVRRDLYSGAGNGTKAVWYLEKGVVH